MTRFLLTTRLIPYPDVHKLHALAAQHGGAFRRKSDPYSPVKGWFEGPSIADDLESDRVLIVRAAIGRLGIPYPEYSAD
jgi:hypothetical protein